MRRYMIFVAIMLVGIIVPASIYAIQSNSKDMKAYNEAIALNYLKNAPTFKFDGILASIKISESWQAQTFAYPGFWGVVIEFDCSHAGYGDRTGLTLAQVITHHSISIHVTEGQVSLAIMDNFWNEMTQRMIN